ncbi:MAG: GHKL domain-containing protein [Nitrospiraceae bacterium]|jgi:signal transduction histidine kinase|nr:MAG: GHKL domain-containing protein [Nitrospiraceae bacterium]
MINPAKRRLTRIFAAVTLLFSVLILGLSYFVVHYSTIREMKRHMNEDIDKEFLHKFYNSGLEPFKDAWNERRFQILNRQGEVVISTSNSAEFYPTLNPEHLQKAFNGKRVFEEHNVLNEPYLISYFSIDGKYIGRAASSLAEAKKYESIFLKLILGTLPGVLLISFFISRYLVNQAMQQISDFFTFQETFSSNVTHELRSPLASLKGNLEVTLRKERGTDEYKDTLALGLKEVDRIINLLNNLNLLASSQSKPLELFTDAVDVRALIDELIRTYKPVLQSKKIHLNVIRNEKATCICDEGLIRRTIENLIDNAVKYTPEGGSIQLDMTSKSGNVLLTITNTCMVMNKDDLGHIFDPFYRGKNALSHNAEGKGLGLYISRYIMRSHGGDITLNNTDGNVFSITLSLPL